MIRTRALALALGMASCACSGSEAADDAGDTPPPPEKRCGEPNLIFSAYSVAELEKYADCTVLVGRFQQDSVAGLTDLAALGNVRAIEGMLNLFRSPGFLTLHGLENLEHVEGTLAIHLNDNLGSLRALEKLHTVTDRLYVHGNPRVPADDLEWLGARVMVGGQKTLD